MGLGIVAGVFLLVVVVGRIVKVVSLDREIKKRYGKNVEE